MTRRADPHGGLLRALDKRFHAIGIAPVLESSRSERWASATFSGARHSFFFTCADDDADALAHVIDTTQIDLPDHFVADIALSPGTAGFTVDALTVESR
jgi:hypothetical protein